MPSLKRQYSILRRCVKEKRRMNAEVYGDSAAGLQKPGSPDIGRDRYSAYCARQSW
jgi:hypothetical protein